MFTIFVLAVSPEVMLSFCICICFVCRAIPELILSFSGEW